MVENMSELQELIEWCKATGVKRLKLSDGVEFELSDIALSERFIEAETKSNLKDRESSSLTSDTMADTSDAKEQQKDDDDDLLYWSSR